MRSEGGAMDWWIWSHLGAAMLGMTLGVILTAILAAGTRAERIAQSAWRSDEHEAGPGR